MALKSLTYRKSGVDISEANRFIEELKPLAQKTHRPEVLSSIGHFAGFFSLEEQFAQGQFAQGGRYQKPVLVASTDGVGTKLKVAIEGGQLEGLGQDLVAMSANDILCTGGEPLFFLDYYATGKLKREEAIAVVRGIAEACRSIHCALLGGETAEMPSVYRKGEFDLAGFMVGIVEKEAIIDGRAIVVGDRILGLSSSGLHSNGFSLVRKIVAEKRLSLNKVYPPLTRPLGKILLEPTRLYVNPILEFKQQLKGIAHITGGGLLENLNRILPEGCRAVIDRSRWRRPPLFELLQKWGSVAEKEMQRVFNCGIGLMVVVREEEVSGLLKGLEQKGERVFEIGWIEKQKKGEKNLEVI